MKDEDRKEIVKKMVSSFEETLKYAFDQCCKRDEEWSKINQDSLILNLQDSMKSSFDERIKKSRNALEINQAASKKEKGKTGQVE